MNILLFSVARCSSIALGILFLLTTAAAMAGGMIELRLNGVPLANQQVTDYTDGSRAHYTTDADGRIESLTMHATYQKIAVLSLVGTVWVMSKGTDLLDDKV